MSGEVYLSSSLVPEVSSTTSFTVTTIRILLGSPSRVLLKAFRHTVLLKITYLIASLASDIDAAI